jgi:hypothetical protein
MVIRFPALPAALLKELIAIICRVRKRAVNESRKMKAAGFPVFLSALRVKGLNPPAAPLLFAPSRPE